MQIPENVKFLIRALYARFPYTADDDSRRAFMRKVAEQLAFDPALRAGWGFYKTEGNGPPSKDLLPYLEPNGTKHGWGISSGGNPPTLEVGEEPLHNPVFHAVEPVNHLGLPEPEPPPEPYPGDLLQRVEKLEADVAHLFAHLRGV